MGTQKPKQKQKQPHDRSGLAARIAAVTLLSNILDQKQSFDVVFASAVSDGWASLSEPRDRAFVRQLVMTCLRRLGQTDEAIDRYLQKKLPSKASRIRHILRMGATEILFLETPAHAAVDNAVQQAASHIKTKSFKGLVNAVMRRISENKEEILKEQDEATLNTPQWLRESWVKAYGKEAAQEIAIAHLSPPHLDLTVKIAKQSDDYVTRLEAERLPTSTLRRPLGGNVTELPGFEDGDWWVQDAAAALPATLLGEIQGKTVIDLCAAPGGKTAQLADQGAHVIAVERTKNRLKTLEQNLERLNLKAECVNADGTKWQPEEPAPFVLLDAPCSATGTLRRHPDVAYLKTPKDVTKLLEAQARLLEAATKMTAPGGTLVYCTCSLQNEEGPDQIEAFLETHPEWKRKPISPDEVGGLDELVTREGDLRTLPSHLKAQGGMDGFYAARLIKG